MSYTCKVRITLDPDGRFVGNFPDLPLGSVVGDSFETCLFNATDCLSEVVAGLEAHRIPLPPAASMADLGENEFLVSAGY